MLGKEIRIIKPHRFIKHFSVKRRGTGPPRQSSSHDESSCVQCRRRVECMPGALEIGAHLRGGIGFQVINGGQMIEKIDLSVELRQRVGAQPQTCPGQIARDWQQLFGGVAPQRWRTSSSA